MLKIKEKEDKDSKTLRLSFLCSLDKARKEGLYFPKRRIRISDTSKMEVLKRIEDQNFNGATEQEIFDHFIINLYINFGLFNNATEMNECWEEMARQIKTFKRKYRKVEICTSPLKALSLTTSESIYESTHQIIKSSCQASDPVDHQSLLLNLSCVVAQGKLVPGSDDFNRICTLVRECMPMHLLKSLYRYDIPSDEKSSNSEELAVSTPCADENSKNLNFIPTGYENNSKPVNFEKLSSLNDVCIQLNNNLS